MWAAQTRFTFVVFSFLAAVSSFSFQAPRTNLRPRKVRGGVVASLEAFSFSQHIVDAAPHFEAIARSVPIDVGNSIPGFLLADAADAIDAADAAAIVNEGGGGFSMPSLPTLPDVWTPWRNFVTSSLVALHDGLYDAGIKENTYGWSIVLFTFSCRLLTFPLTWIQYSSTEKMKAIQPYTEEIKKKYKDPQVQNMVMAKLYEDTGSNPLAGCLPSLFQIPVFIALYRSILNLANDKTLEESFFFLPTLEGPTLTEKLQLPQGRGVQWLTEGWTGSWEGGDLVPFLGWHDTLAYVSIPIFLVLAQSFSQRIMTPPTSEEDLAANPSLRRTQAILKYIPLMIGWFSLQVPCGLGLYWITSNTFSTSSVMAIKAYFKANPPAVEWDYLENEAKKGMNDAALMSLNLPANMEEATTQARENPRPALISRRTGEPVVAMIPSARL